MEDGFMELRHWAPVRARQSVNIRVRIWNPLYSCSLVFIRGFVRPNRISSSHRGNHQVLRGMIGRNEFEYLGVVPGPFEQVSAQRVGDKLRLPLKQDAVLERLRKNRRRAELRAQLLMTAGCDEYQCGAGLDTFRDGVVGRRVARMQRDEDIDPVERRAFDRAGFELKSAEPALTR